VLLQASPRITVLATSRAPLEMTEEQTVEVAPLQTPADAGALSTTPAGALFLSRLHRPLEPHEAADAVELLSVLDGLPLAVELAAGAARAVGVANALRQARRGPAALPPARGAVSRHRSLSAALDWSHRLLGEDEQVVLRRLSVFSGGFREDAAVRVVSGAEDLDPDRASLALTHLVGASLVSVGSAPARRMRLLEVIGAYAAQKLSDPAERAAAQSAHVDVITMLAETLAPDDLDAELPNLRAAVAYAVEQEDDRAVRLAAAAAPYWQLRGLWTEGRFWLERALAVAPDAPHAARAYARLATLCRRAGDSAAAEVAAQAALALQPDQATETEALIALGGVLQSGQRLDEAEQVYARALEQAQASGDSRAAVLALRSLAAVQYERRDFSRARGLAEQALVLARASGDPYLLGPVLNGLGAVLVADGRPGEGRALIEEGLAVRRRSGDVPGEAATLLNLADAMHRAGEYHASLEVAHASFTLWSQLGELHLAAALAGNLAGTLLELGEPRAACLLLGAALTGEYRFPAYALEEYETARERVRAELGQQAEDELALGRSLGLQEAAARALSSLGAAR
jgi:predicted ATPase